MTPKHEQAQDETPTLSLRDRVKALAAEARAKKLWIAILDVRYITAGIPTEITDEYIYFDGGDGGPWELDSTGKLGSDEAKGEKGLAKMLLWGALIHVELMKPIKGAK